MMKKHAGDGLQGAGCMRRDLETALWKERDTVGKQGKATFSR